MKKILITPKSFKTSGEKPFSILKEAGYEIIENTTGKTFTEYQMVEQCKDIDGIIVGIDPISEKVLRAAKNLKAISKYGAGLDNIDLNVAKELGIKVDRAAGTNSVSVAELAVGMFFALARSIPAVNDKVRAGGWDRVKGVELTGKTVGILGLGSIGKIVAKMCYGIGMGVIAYDPFVNSSDEALVKYNIEMTSLDEVIKNADFLSLHLPLTEETRDLINKDTLASMKNTAYLVNTARGELIDEEALYEALSTGIIAGAAEDVFSKEPPGDHKILKLDNFILTSHIGAFTKEANEKMAVVSAENLVKMLGA